MKKIDALQKRLENIELSNRRFHVLLYEMDNETEDQAIKRFVKDNNAKETDTFIKIGVLPEDRERARELIEGARKSS